MNFRKSLLIPSALLALVAASSPFAGEDAKSCTQQSHFSGPFESGPFVVSTYHVTGVPGSTRVVDLTWPTDLKQPFSGANPDREDGAEESMGFDFFRPESLPDTATGETITLPTFTLSIRGADKLPLYSRIRRVGGGGIGELLKSEEGHTYMSSDGFDILTDPSPEGWVEFSYPNSIGPIRGRDSWFRGDPVPGRVDLLLSCDRGTNVQYTLCRVFGKVEPLFYDFFFDATGLDRLEQMNDVAEEFVACLLEGF